MFKSAEKTALQEIGPRFTLKLRYMKKGIPAVHQFGAAPPPLVFDDEDVDEEEAIPADSALPDTVTEKHDAPVASPAPQNYATPAKDEEYIWQWKVRRR